MKEWLLKADQAGEAAAEVRAREAAFTQQLASIRVKLQEAEGISEVCSPARGKAIAPSITSLRSCEASKAKPLPMRPQTLTCIRYVSPFESILHEYSQERTTACNALAEQLRVCQESLSGCQAEAARKSAAAAVAEAALQQTLSAAEADFRACIQARSLHPATI